MKIRTYGCDQTRWMAFLLKLVGLTLADIQLKSNEVKKAKKYIRLENYVSEMACGVIGSRWI